LNSCHGRHFYIDTPLGNMYIEHIFSVPWLVVFFIKPKIYQLSLVFCVYVQLIQCFHIQSPFRDVMVCSEVNAQYCNDVTSTACCRPNALPIASPRKKKSSKGLPTRSLKGCNNSCMRFLERQTHVTSFLSATLLILALRCDMATWKSAGTCLLPFPHASQEYRPPLR
jgi:hypothetical protein